MKTALGAFGGVLTTLLVVACWQSRATADPGLTAFSAPASAQVQAACVPTSALTTPVATPMYQPASMELVSLDRPTYVPARQVVRSAAPRRYVTRETRETRRRSWAKTALVIGGSAGAGAGIGALAGGKKGALAGAAIGGGAASLFEAFKR
jgi:hypothetical protein